MGSGESSVDHVPIGDGMPYGDQIRTARGPELAHVPGFGHSALSGLLSIHMVNFMYLKNKSGLKYIICFQLKLLFKLKQTSNG